MTRIRVQLSGRGWTQSGGANLRVRGTVFSRDGLRYQARQAGEWLPALGADVHAWSGAVSYLNGFFALIRCDATRLVAVADRIRSMPLFYAMTGGEFLISDDAEWVRSEARQQCMNPVARDEFRLTGYVTGGDTLYENVKQLQAGEMLLFDAANPVAPLVLHRYFRYWHTEPDASEPDALQQRFETAAMAGVRRLIDVADGRQIAVPLSGGYDSRLIVTLLQRFGYRNVLTFTYGINGNKEAVYSRQVAQSLGFAWHFIEYGNRQWREAWNTAERRQYQRWASGWSSLPHVQDWVAVRALRASGIAAPDCIFAPGHSCVRRDIGIAQGTPAMAPATVDQLVEQLIQKHYIRSAGKQGPRRDVDAWRSRVLSRLECGPIRSAAQLASAHEKWEWQERQSKFICNSVRVYEFFDCDWWLPLWDAELVQLWQKMPLPLRAGRHWYDTLVRRFYAEQTHDTASAVLRNAEDIGLFGQAARRLVKAFAPGMKETLKSVRDTVLPRRYTNSYIVSHLTREELRRLRSEGLREDGILLHEFLGLAP